jgi:hypothetical protein
MLQGATTGVTARSKGNLDLRNEQPRFAPSEILETSELSEIISEVSENLAHRIPLLYLVCHCRFDYDQRTAKKPFQNTR